ncbi:MAG TPA: 1-deoxy-D-xylulose-5-phosphate reductoisomerase [Candidatus Krumholzibacteria bacterium]|nr:1-deoxy-D-xylulose-5-phosphate reductoisomerase [Candidatus Krumholzibacteria bacterium]HPD71120.1 1-deoxy-D-xylulose-5-phosphate reductoisomerase [Candidatus Krumholzibacteria bacterium]HRY39180.1 1-deoxy-D-xylulose-5-phosphate reductoisomerase [Candidatus Krumholzibacteria bacterium]
MTPALYPFARPRPLPEPLRLAVLGATGSIGRQTLDLVHRFPDRLRVTAASAHRRWEDLARALGDQQPLVAVVDPGARDAAARAGVFGDRLLPEADAAQLVAAADCDIAVNGIVGAAGLGPTLAAARRGLRIALANKESLVVGGDLVQAAVQAGGAELLPVDSEHSAVAQCLCGRRREDLEQVILTASGGPFREMPAAQLASVSLDAVLSHPTWTMGPKITVDSATLMNKGLEVIEAHHLFGLPYADIEVIVHPGSWIHSLVRLRDGALLAQLGMPDMRLALLYAITGEARWPLGGERLDLLRIGELRFEAPDAERFPCLGLARAAGEAGGSAPITLNAANEVAVSALLGGTLRYVDLPGVIAATLARLPAAPIADLAAALAADREARRVAGELLDRRGGSTTLRGEQ